MRVRLAAALALAVATTSLTLPHSMARTTTKQQPGDLVLTMAASGNGATVVQGYLDSTPDTTFTIELFSSPSCGEMGTLLGSSFHTTDGSGHASFTSAVDVEVQVGHQVVMATASAGSINILSNCQPLVRDSAPPTVTVGDLPTFQTETSFPVTWQGSDQTEVRFHVVFRQADFDGGFGDEQALVINSTATSEAFSGKPGKTYCFRVLATDLLGNSSSTGEECTAVLVDDASMKHRKGFKQRSGGDHFMGTFSWAKLKGATLILPEVQADQLALLIDRCKRCGKLKVTFPGVKRKVSLKGPKDTRVIVSLADLGARTSGTLRIKNLKDRPVRVDGVGVSAV